MSPVENYEKKGEIVEYIAYVIVGILVAMCYYFFAEYFQVFHIMMDGADSWKVHGVHWIARFEFMILIFIWVFCFWKTLFAMFYMSLIIYTFVFIPLLIFISTLL